MKRMSPCEVTLAITAISNAIAQGLSTSELNLASAVFSQIGDTPAPIAAQCGIPEELSEAGSDGDT